MPFRCFSDHFGPPIRFFGPLVRFFRNVQRTSHTLQTHLATIFAKIHWFSPIFRSALHNAYLTTSWVKESGNSFECLCADCLLAWCTKDTSTRNACPRDCMPGFAASEILLNWEYVRQVNHNFQCGFSRIPSVWESTVQANWQMKLRTDMFENQKWQKRSKIFSMSSARLHCQQQKRSKIFSRSLAHFKQ